MHQKQKIITELEDQKNAMIAALWANSNWDDDKGTRTRAISDINSSHEDAIRAIEDAVSNKQIDEEEKLDKDNPFFAAAERGLQKIEKDNPELAEQIKNRKSEEKIDYMKGLDQE